VLVFWYQRVSTTVDASPLTLADTFHPVCSARPHENGVLVLSSTLVGAVAPTLSFGDLGLPGPLVEILTAKSITAPLPIQAATVADALEGRDVSGKAPTGSGKTLAFALPVAARVGRAKARHPKALVLAPTRELAAQIAHELNPLLGARGLRAHTFYGGVAFGGQRQALRKRVDVAVGCPGRIEDLMRSKDIVLSDVEMVVIDEADRMADMGFLPAVRRILDTTSTRRQTLLFSATLDGDVDVLVRHYQRNPVHHEVAATKEMAGQAIHRFEAIAHGDRVAACATLVASERSSIVFVRTKHGADRLARQLSRCGVNAEAIHGGRSQPQRDRTLAAFRAGRVQALVATDVAARGIHVDAVACVIHFDLPHDAKDYVHRSGRTARAGETGIVVTFVLPDQTAAASALHRVLDVDIEGMATRATGTAPASGRPRHRVNRGAVAGRGRRPSVPHGRSKGPHRRRNPDR
jgi:superfamily II DNA/RNA helicase